MGAFHQPVLAVCAPSCLETLPEAEMSCGWAKVIKYAALRADGLLPTLEGPVTEEVLADIISTCVEIKRDIVSEDEFEGGVRAGLCDPQALPVLEHLLEKFGLTGLCPYDAEALLEAARSDKKSAGSAITLILPEAFGRCRTERTFFEKLRDLIQLGLNP